MAGGSVGFREQLPHLLSWNLPDDAREPCVAMTASVTGRKPQFRGGLYMTASTDAGVENQWKQ